MNDKKRDKLGIAIIVLTVLLALSICFLAGAVIHNRLKANKGTTVTVPDNLITSDENTIQNTETDETGSSEESSQMGENSQTEEGSSTNENHLTDKTQDTDSSVPPFKNTSAAVNGAGKQTAAAISLYNRQPLENIAFSATNMFPGDREVKYYRVQVSYHDEATVHFRADVQKGYEKLAEVLKVRVKLLTTGEILYEGLMEDMPQSVTHKLTSPDSTTAELFYEISAYLDTSAGNEYQNKALIANFRWWVEETGNLDQAPQTGDSSPIMLWAIVAAVSALLCIILLIFRRKEEEQAK